MIHRFALAALVAVDVGHHYVETGVVSAIGVPEFEYNVALAREVKRELEAGGHTVRLIGDQGLHTTFGMRTRDARGADLFVSIHHDSVKERWLLQADKFAGYSLFVSHLNPKPDESLACASAIGARLRGAGFTPSLYHADPWLGENRPFADQANGVHWYDNLAVAKSAAMPSVLVEAGVLVNREEERRMRDPLVRKRIAVAIAAGVNACLTK